jgi:hypothetical protein
MKKKKNAGAPTGGSSREFACASSAAFSQTEPDEALWVAPPSEVSPAHAQARLCGPSMHLGETAGAQAPCAEHLRVGASNQLPYTL